MKSYALNNGVTIPVLGFGTWKAENGEIAYQAVLEALKAGYRHIDTAAIYKNEALVVLFKIVAFRVRKFLLPVNYGIQTTTMSKLVKLLKSL